jgi:hypothetical protein
VYNIAEPGFPWGRLNCSHTWTIRNQWHKGGCVLEIRLCLHITYLCIFNADGEGQIEEEVEEQERRWDWWITISENLRRDRL